MDSRCPKRYDTVRSNTLVYIRHTGHRLASRLIDPTPILLNFGICLVRRSLLDVTQLQVVSFALAPRGCHIRLVPSRHPAFEAKGSGAEGLFDRTFDIDPS